MARDENPPFAIGNTYFNGATPDATAGKQHEGQEYWVEDHDYSTGTVGANPTRSGRKRLVRVVRNMNATALAAKKIAKLKLDGTTPDVLNGQVDGLCGAVTDKGYPVDEFLGAQTVPQYDLFFIVIDGLATCTAAGAVAAGGVVVPGAAGAVAAQGAIDINQVHNAIGRAALAVGGAGDIIIDVGATHR